MIPTMAVIILYFLFAIEESAAQMVLGRTLFKFAHEGEDDAFGTNMCIGRMALVPDSIF